MRATEIPMRGVRAMLVAFTAAGLLILTVPPARADIVTLAPYVTGSFTGGNGVNSHWVQVRAGWKGPSTLAPVTLGGVSTLPGVSTLWDADAALGMSSSDPRVLRQTNAVLSTVNVGNQLYNYDVTHKWKKKPWGMVDSVPLFPAGAAGDSYQTDYAGHVWGYIAVTTPGQYNFGVLSDDGFRFTLVGANGSHSMSLDGLSPRKRFGFGQDASNSGYRFTTDCDCNLELGTGLYYFDLIGYNHLEAGVLNLGWWQGSKNWAFETIPQSHLFTDADIPAPVPLPAALWLMVSGLLGLFGLGLARRRTPAPA